MFYEELLVGLHIHSCQPDLDPIDVAAEHVQVTFVEQLCLGHDGDKSLDELGLQRFYRLRERVLLSRGSARRATYGIADETTVRQVHA